MPPTNKKRQADCPHCHQLFTIGRQLSSHVAKCIHFDSEEMVSIRQEENDETDNSHLIDNGSAIHSNSLPPDVDESSFNHPEDQFEEANLHVAVQFNNSQVSLPTRLARDDLVHLSLLRMCHEINLPLYAYDNILQWAQDSYRMGYTFPRAAPSRQIFLNQLYEMYDMKGCIPTVHSVNLTGNDTAEVVTFSFEEMVRSLLSDPELFVPENVLFSADSDSPIIPPHNGDNLGEIVSGDWYASAFAKLCTAPNDFLCPLVLFIDKTHVDEFSCWTLEPVLFTLAVFNRSTRNLSKAWRPLGLVTDSNRRSSAQNANSAKVSFLL